MSQYIPYLEQHGVHCQFDALLGERAYQSPGAVRGAASGVAALRRLLRAALMAPKTTVVVHREAIPFPSAIVERYLSARVNRLIFDFDDAIFLPQPGRAGRVLRWMRSPEKFSSAVAAADHVLAGNRFLAEHARKYNRCVSVLPTTVDTSRITPRPRSQRSTSVVIGWIGTPSTVGYLKVALPAIKRVLQRHPHAEVKLVGARYPAARNESRWTSATWRLDEEAAQLHSFDIGIMPLPDDEWTRGKCAYKALQYMSAAVPTIASPVGVVPEIIQDGVNGHLAADVGDWEARLSELVESTVRRRALGEAGRETIEQRFSVHAWAPRFAEILLGL